MGVLEQLQHQGRAVSSLTRASATLCMQTELHNRPLGTRGTAPHPAQLPAPQCWSPNAVSLLPLGVGGDPSSTPEPAPQYLELLCPLH